MGKEILLSEFCKKWGLSDTHFEELCEIFSNCEVQREDGKTITISVPKECDSIAVGYLKGDQIIKMATIDTDSKEVTV